MTGRSLNSGSKMPLLRLDNTRAQALVSGPASKVAINAAMRGPIYVRPTDAAEKLYGGSENIMETVTANRTADGLSILRTANKLTAPR